MGLLPATGGVFSRLMNFHKRVHHVSEKYISKIRRECPDLLTLLFNLFSEARVFFDSG